MPKHLLVRTVSSLARGVDLAFAGTALNPPKAMRRKSPAESLGHEARMRGLAAIGGFYNREEFLKLDSPFFPKAEAITPRQKRVRSLPQGEVIDLSWPSEFVPLWSTQAVSERFSALPEETLARLGLRAGVGVSDLMKTLGIDRSGELKTKYLSVKGNCTAHARWYRHAAGSRPCVVMLHGYMAGTFALEERMWPVRRLYDAGMDVVLMVLPFHGPRRSEARGFAPPAFPSSDPRFTIEGFRQLVFDTRALFDFLEGAGAKGLGVMGMSLGGYSAALLGTLDSRLRFAVMHVPLAAIDEFAYANGRMVGQSHEQLAQRDALRAAQWAVSPLSRAPLVRGEDVLVTAGEADVVTGLVHAERLATHFQGKLTRFEGGHLLQFGRARAFSVAWDMLERGGHLERTR